MILAFGIKHVGDVDKKVIENSRKWSYLLRSFWEYRQDK